MVSEKINCIVFALDSDLRSKGDAAVEESVVGLPEGFFLVFFEQSYRKFTAANYSKSYKISFMESYNRLNDIQIL